MNKKFYYSIYFVILAPIFAIVSIMTLIQASNFHSQAKENFIYELKKDSHISLTQLENNVAHFIKSYEIHEYEKLVKNAMDHENISAIVVKDYYSGKILGNDVYMTGSIRDVDWNIVDFDKNNKTYQEMIKNAFYIETKDIIDSNSGNKLATISIYSSDKLINERLDSSVVNIVFNSVATLFLLVIILFIVMYFVILKPISQMVSNINDKDKDGIPLHKLQKYKTIETNILATTINNMIDAIKLSREKLKESEFRWTFATEGKGDGLWDWNMETNEVYFSPMWKKMLGFEENEIENNFSEWEKRVKPEHLEKAFKDLQAHLDGKTQYYENEHQILCKDGSYKWILDRGVVVSRDDNGKPIRMIGTHSDITKRKEIENKVSEQTKELEMLNKNLGKRVEDELSERIKSVRLFKDIIDSTDIFISLHDKEYRYVVANKKLAQIHNKQPEELIGKTPVEAGTISQERFESISKSIFERVLKGESINYKDWLESLMGRRYIEFNFLPFIPDRESKNIEGFIVISRDITEQHRLEQENFQNQKKGAMGDLIGIIAHQLKQPLNSLRLNKEVLIQDFEMEEVTQKSLDTYSEKVDKQINFMAESIDELRNFFSPNKQVKPFFIKRSIERAMAIIEPNINSKGIETIREYKSDSTINGIESELQQVIINIVTNAKEVLVEKRPKNPFIKITTYEEEKKIIIEIEDNGGGITEENLPKIFDSYFTTKGEKGTGIGLNLSKMIIEDSMGGKISARNSETGAIFKIELNKENHPGLVS